MRKELSDRIRKSMLYTLIWLLSIPALMVVWSILLRVLGEWAWYLGYLIYVPALLFKYVLLFPYSLATKLVPECWLFKDIFPPFGFDCDLFIYPLAIIIAFSLIFLVFTLLDKFKK